MAECPGVRCRPAVGIQLASMPCSAGVDLDDKLDAAWDLAEGTGDDAGRTAMDGGYGSHGVPDLISYSVAPAECSLWIRVAAGAAVGAGAGLATSYVISGPVLALVSLIV